MKIIDSPDEMQRFSRNVRHSGKRLGFVPTMGALHAGHLSLVKTARGQADCVAASIFVNPLQFGPNEDFSKYPRTFDRDCQLLEAEKVDVLFAPNVQAMYPGGAKTTVEVAELSERLDGKSRPGHFKGVTTVVSKLLNIVQPDVAFFGQKDAAQAAIIRRMVRDLNMDVQIVVCPIVREADGLAMSSRNAYLSPAERKVAGQLNLVLKAAIARLLKGDAISDVEQAGAAALMEAGFDTVDYVAVRDAQMLAAVADLSKPVRILAAGKIGRTRLIDNMAV